MDDAIKVTWVGLRGFPGVQGGVEAHAEQLCPMLQKLGCEVTVLTRRCHQREGTGAHWHGVHFVNLWAPRHKHLEAVVHTFLAITYAGLVSRPDVLHIQAIGPGLWTLWARVLGLRVVVTHHGPDHERQKWGRLAKWVIRLGESTAAHWASELIVISRVIQRAVRATFGRDAVLIGNGLSAPPAVSGLDALPDGLSDWVCHGGRYLLLVSRLVPEKRHLDLIAAFQRAELPGWQLVIVGAADHADVYAQSVVEAAQRVGPRVVLTGFQTGAALAALYAHAGLFVLPSSHEGLPIALLEALSFGTRVLASDIPANLEIGLPPGSYFPLGDVDALAWRLEALTATPNSAPERRARQQAALAKYSWSRSARETAAVYERLCHGAAAFSLDWRSWPS